MKVPALILGLAILGTILAPAGAEPSLTLREAIAKARCHSPLLRGSQIALDQAEAARRFALADRGPRLGMSSVLSHSNNAAGSFIGTNGWDTKLAVSQTVFDAHRVSDALEQAAIARQKAEADTEGADLDLQYEVARDYLDLLRTQELVKAAEFDVSQANAQLDIARQRLRGSAGTQLDVLQAQSLLAGARDRLLQSQTNRFTANLRLEAVLGETVGALQVVELPLPAMAQLDAASESVVLSRRPDLRSLEAVRRSLEVTAVQRSRGTLPTFDAAGNVTESPVTGTTLGVTGTLTWSLVDWGRIDEQVHQAKLDAVRAEATLQARQESDLLELRSVREALRTGRQRIELTRGQLNTAKEALSLANLRFERGVGTSLEVIQALTAVNQAQTAAITARYDEKVVTLRWAQALALPVTTLLADAVQ